MARSQTDAADLHYEGGGRGLQSFLATRLFRVSSVTPDGWEATYEGGRWEVWLSVVVMTFLSLTSTAFLFLGLARLWPAPASISPLAAGGLVGCGLAATLTSHYLWTLLRETRVRAMLVVTGSTISMGVWQGARRHAVEWTAPPAKLVLHDAPDRDPRRWKVVRIESGAEVLAKVTVDCAGHKGLLTLS